MRNFVIHHHNGEIEERQLNINPQPRVVSQYLKRLTQSDTTPQAIITALHGEVVVWKRGRDYFDCYGGDKEINGIITDFMQNLDGNEFAKLFEHVVGCEAKCISDDASGTEYGYNIGA